MKTIACFGVMTVLLGQPISCLASADTAPASNETATVDDAAEKKSFQRKVRPQVMEILERRYTSGEGHITVSLDLEDPVAVEGRNGRWKVPGTAKVSSYRKIAPQREEELGRNPKLSARQIRRIIARETFIRSEVVNFELDVEMSAATPEVSFTLK